MVLHSELWIMVIKYMPGMMPDEKPDLDLFAEVGTTVRAVTG